MFEGWNYYRNLEAEDFAALPLDTMFSAHGFYVNRNSCDLYFVGLKKPFDVNRAQTILATIGEAISVDDKSPLTAHLAALLDGLADLDRAGSNQLEAEIAKTQERLKHVRAALKTAQNEFESLKNSRSFKNIRWMLPSLKRRVDRLHRIIRAT